MASYQRRSSSRPRNKVVKPILRKFAQGERDSIDLDRTAAEQDGLGIYADYGTGSRSARDVTFDHSSRRGYHNRSTSGTSQFSTGTAGSQRAGSFVHPFQQTPRPYTPPLGASHPTSLRGSSFGAGAGVGPGAGGAESEYSKESPALTEDELESQDQLRQTLRSTSNLSNRSASGTTSPNPNSRPLRIQTKSHNSRPANSPSHTNLATSLYSPDLISPTDTVSTMSAVRSSMDKGFRMRSRSDAEGRPRAESIQEARRKFEEKERVKDEKAAQAEIKAREKRDQKEARSQIERGHRRSSASERTYARSRRSKSDLTMPVNEKEEHDFAETRRTRTAVSTTKKKSQSTWTKFMFWFRTRLLRIKSKKSNGRH
ncbi:hypothetical protein PVAG01_04413 [Phlyctema vagabunda]|uniref:Uncharacterized protein n=1 Tax=Phlyctema vagabunda TaxID=108571 RepID=A0ABR4PP65_9HELO